MKKIGFLLIVFIFKSCMTDLNAQDFYIMFGSGFSNDTVSLNIDRYTIFSNIVFTSDSVLGLSNDAELIFKDKHISVFKNGIVLSTMTFEYNRNLEIVISINKKPYKFYLDLKKGKYLVINKHQYYYNVNINQYKKPILLE